VVGLLPRLIHVRVVVHGDLPLAQHLDLVAGHDDRGAVLGDVLVGARGGDYKSRAMRDAKNRLRMVFCRELRLKRVCERPRRTAEAGAPV